MWYCCIVFVLTSCTVCNDHDLGGDAVMMVCVHRLWICQQGRRCAETEWVFVIGESCTAVCTHFLKSWYCVVCLFLLSTGDLSQQPQRYKQHMEPNLSSQLIQSYWVYITSLSTTVLTSTITVLTAPTTCSLWAKHQDFYLTSPQSHWERLLMLGEVLALAAVPISTFPACVNTIKAEVTFGSHSPSLVFIAAAWSSDSDGHKGSAAAQTRTFSDRV